MKKTAWTVFLSFFIILLIAAASHASPSRVVSLGILPVQDESGAQVPDELLRRVSQDFRQKLTLSYQDVLVRLVSDMTGTAGPDVEQLAAMGKRQGVRYLVRSGVLGLKCDRGTTCDASLYAELIASDSGEITSLRANGTGTETGTAIDDPGRWDTYDFKSGAFAQTALGQALNSAIDQLAQQVHQAVAPAEQATSATVAPEGTPQPPTGDQGGSAYEADQELQQLIAQADALVAGGGAGGRDIGPLQQALEGLRTALNTKVSLTTQGQDTSAVDQDIARYKTDLQTVIAASTQEAAAQPVQSEPQQGSVDLKSEIARINELLSEAMTSLLKIQEMRTAVQGFNQDEPSSPVETDQTYSPVVEPTSDVSGAVIDSSGNPVEGATVTDPQSGASATTDSSGSYTIPNIPSGRFSILKVVKAGRELSTGKIQLQPGRTAYADWQIGNRGAGTGTPGIKILPATVFLAPQKGVPAGKSGVIKGVVRDAQGRPVARAQVLIKGLGMARTDSLGAYTFVNVPQGDYQLMIQKGGSTAQPERVKVAAKKTAEITTVYRAKALAFTAPGKTALLAGGGGVTLKGRVAGSNSQSLRGAKVTVVGNGVAMSLLTDSKGNYEFKKLKEGTYRILAGKAGFQETGGTVVLRNGQGVVRNFSLDSSSAEIRKALSVRPSLVPAATGTATRPASARAAAVSDYLYGVVRDARSGKPIEGATVMVSGQKNVRTDRLGNYRIDNVPPGNYRVAVSHRNYQATVKTVTVRSGIPCREYFSLTVKDAQRSGVMTTPLRPAPAAVYGNVRGRVTDSMTGRPVPHATVKLLNRSTRTDTSGGYHLDNIPAGNHVLTVEKVAYQRDSRRISVKAGATANADFRLVPKSR